MCNKFLSGGPQRLFWRRDRLCFFINWLVITTATGRIVLSHSGFVGHLHDSTVFW